jgi:hypothetical protein
MLLSGRVDIMMTHDWPQGVCHHGNLQQLLRHKPFLKQDIDSGELGNPHAMHLMRSIRPRFWFSAHMHCKFPARVQHPPPAHPAAATATQFLALDKVCCRINNELPLPLSRFSRSCSSHLVQVLPGRDFLQFLEFKNGDFCDPDASHPSHAPASSAAEPPTFTATGTHDEHRGQIDNHDDATDTTLNIAWDPQWLLITRLFHPLFPSTPSSMLPPHSAALAALSAVTCSAVECNLSPPPFELPVAPVVDPSLNLQVCSLSRLQLRQLPHAHQQTAALLKQMQLQATFEFSQEQQLQYLAQTFGFRASASAAVAAAPALPHGSSRVAAFLASNHLAAAAFTPMIPGQEEPPVLDGPGAGQNSGRLLASTTAPPTNPDEISLE